MKYEAVFKITNSSQETKTLILEPWAEEFEMLSGKSFEFAAKAEHEGNFKVEFGDDTIVVWAWSSATIKVFCDGEELGVGNFERQAVPDVPAGQSVSSFLGLLFGKK